jgi:CDP-diacylglycerol--glycerol-3-phosphate 3-phosphatidyltransferase
MLAQQRMSLLTGDCALAAGGLFAALAVVVLYFVRTLRRGRHSVPRVEQLGSSVLLGKWLMEAGLWALAPVVRTCVKLGISPNGITATALVLAASGAGCVLAGHFGTAAALTALASLCDTLDGHVARASGQASRGGEIFDAASDRYAEFFLLAALAVFFRLQAGLLALSLFTLLGSFMVSYASAKAEAAKTAVPRGLMRRPERAVYLTTGVALTPLWQWWAQGKLGTQAWLPWLPVVMALAIVGVLANISAVSRLMAVAGYVPRAFASAPAPGRARRWT